MLRLDLLENLLEKLTALKKVVRQIDETPMRDDINF